MGKNRYYIPKIIYNTRPPNTSDDESNGYIIGQPWVDVENKKYYICTSIENNNAIWKEINLEITEGEYQVGKSTFLSSNFPRYIYPALTKQPTFVSVFPIEQPRDDKTIGDIWAVIEDDNIQIYNTGEAQTAFCWFICSELFEYNSLEININNANLGYVYTSPYSGIIDSEQTIIWFPKNQDLILYAISHTHHDFDRWWGYDELNQSDDRIAYLHMDNNKVVDADFKTGQHTLTVDIIDPDFGGVYSTPGGISCNSGPCSNDFDRGTTVELEYILQHTDAQFVRWEGCDEVDDDKCIVTLDRDRHIQAVFRSSLRRLVVSIVGDGVVTSQNVSGIDCGSENDECIGYFEPGTSVDLNASANFGYTFLAWSGDLEGWSTNEIVVMEDDRFVVAIFEPREFILSVKKDGNGTIFSNDEKIDCSYLCKNTFTYNTEIVLEAKPDESTKFVKWVIDNEDKETENPLAIVVENHKDIKAVFDIKEYNVDITAGPYGSIDVLGGNVNSNIMNILDVATTTTTTTEEPITTTTPEPTITTTTSTTTTTTTEPPPEFISMKFYHGDDVVIRPIPNDGYEVDKWTGCDEIINNQCYIYNVSNDKIVNVTFKERILGPSDGAEYGYICGGKDTKSIGRFTFAYNVGSSYVNDLIEKNYNSSANHSSTHAYICGGQSEYITYNYIQQFSFKFDDAELSNDCFLDKAKHHTAANNSSVKGFICGGNLDSKDIQEFVFPFDKGKTESRSELTNKHSGSGFNSSQYGYITGMIETVDNILQPQKTNNKFDFSTDTNAIEEEELITCYINPTSCNSSTHGYIINGVKFDNNGYKLTQTFNTLSFSLNNGTVEEYSDITDQIHDKICANNSSQYGYICGGHDLHYVTHNTVTRIDFSTNAQLTDSQQIYLHENKHSATATDGTIFE